MSKGKCSGLLAALVLGLATIVGWGLYEPRIADDIAAEAERVDALHAALAKARVELLGIEADPASVPRLRDGQVEATASPARPAPVLDPKPLHTPEVWNAEFLERACFDDPSIGPGDGPSPSIYLSSPTGLPFSLRISVPDGPFRTGEDDERGFWPGWRLRAALTRRYAIVYGEPGKPTGWQTSLPVALIDLRDGKVRDAVILEASEGEKVTEYTVRRLLEQRWGAKLDKADTDPLLLERNRQQERLVAPAWIAFTLFCFLIPVGAIRWSNRIMLSALRGYGERFGFEYGAQRILLIMKQYPWAEGQIDGRSVSYRTTIRRRVHVGILEVDAKVPSPLRGVIKRRAKPLDAAEAAAQVGSDDPGFIQAFAVEGDAAAISGVLDAKTREGLSQHLIGALELREDRLVFDRGFAFLGNEKERERFEAMTDLLVRLATTIEGR